MQFLLLYDTCSLLCYVWRWTVNVTLFIVCYSVQKYRTGQSLPGIRQPSVSAWLHSPLQWYGVASLQSSRERCRGGHQPTWAGLWEEEWGCVSGRHASSAYITHESCTFKSCWHSSTEWNFFCCFFRMPTTVKMKLRYDSWMQCTALQEWLEKMWQQRLIFLPIKQPVTLEVYEFPSKIEINKSLNF